MEIQNTKHTIYKCYLLMNQINNTSQPIIMDKGKQKEGVVQNEEIFLYKPYNILTKASTLTTSESGLM